MFGPDLFAVLTVSASAVLGQAVWESDQISTRICQWQQLRAAVLRDTVYLDGGNLWWEPKFADGRTERPVDDRNPLGHMYTLNFSTPFDTADNISAILGVLETGGGDTNSRAPTYEDGALLGNNAEFFLYGGLMGRPYSTPDPPGNEVLYYEKYLYGADRPFSQPFNFKALGGNMTRYITSGGAASAPSENLAWYFSGMRSATWGKIYKPGSNTNGSFDATEVSNTLITLDMGRQRFETFKNVTLPPGMDGRANPELVWVPVGRRGILVSLGGVVYPDFASTDAISANETVSKWHSQKTVGGPGQLTRGCAVVARAQDGSSFNIYYYGGYDGLDSKKPFSSDVWVLSLPSFTWVKLASGGADGRAGHKCVTPYPDQMLAIGGYQALAATVPKCLDETIRVFNLTTGKWLTRYDPAVYANYTIPSAVVDKIGGSGTGGATATAPSPSWDATELAAVFKEQYPMSKITTFYPYASVGPVNNTNPDVPPPDDGGDSGGGLPSYLPPVLGVVLGLVFLTMVAVLILLWRRRRLLRRNATASEAGTEDTNGNRIASWLRGQPTEVKTPTLTNSSEYLPVSSTEVDSSVTGAAPPMSIAEMMDTGQIAEL
ncbi:hypothetical protein F5144DRAFT_534528, partial [Chaetomium tenue]